MSHSRFVANVPMHLDCPPQMQDAVRYVLQGEYESHYDGPNDGSGLDILDIGANVGGFARWAELRWPGSTIRCYEPNPGTFAYLERNIAGRPGIRATNAAVYPGLAKRAPFFSRYDGDGEAGLVAYATDTFRGEAVKPAFEVDVIEPASVAGADILKLDVEGAEAEILAHLDLSRTQLVLAEFQNGKNRAAMQAVLARDFVPVIDESCPWDPILDYADYRADLKGDVYGHMFYVRRGTTKLVHRPPA